MRSLKILMMVLLALFALASCNPDEDSGNNNGTSGNGNGDAGNGDATSEASGDPVKLGFCFEETGDAATFGVSSRKGAEMAIEELRKGNGILGRPIEATFDDNASKPEQATTVASKLVNTDKVDVVIGSVASSNSLAMARVVEEAEIPMVTPASTKVSLTLNDDGSTRKYIFRTCFTDDFQGEAMVDFAVNGPLQAKNAVVFYAADNDYAKGIYETVMAAAPGKGLNIVAEDSFLSTTETDFRSKLNRFKGMDFDVIILPGYYKEAALISNQARELGINQPFLGGDGFDSPDLWDNAGANIEGSYFTNHYASDDEDPAVQDFINKYKQKHGGNVPDAMAILAYDCVMVVADAMERAGSTDADAVVAALNDTANYKGASGTITIDEKHNAQKKLVVLEIVEGGDKKWVYSYEPGSSSGGSAMADNPCGGNPCDEGDNPCGA